jgi:hypothetical protein
MTQMPASFAACTNRTAVDHQRLPGVDRQQRRTGRAHRRNRRDADDGNVEAHVLVRLGDLDDAHAGAGQVPGARDHGVGAFHRLDRDDRRGFHGDGLPDVEAGNRVGDPVAELEVGAFLGVGSRLVRTPSRAINGARNAVESIS